MTRCKAPRRSGFKIFYLEFPFIALAERRFEALCEYALFFKVNIAIHIAGSAASARGF